MGEVSERCSPTRLLLTQEELTNMDKEQLLQNWYKQENYINWIESQLSNAQTLAPVMEEKLRHQVSTETSRRENYLLMRLNAKEQEVQELLIQIQESKSALGGNAVALRSTLMDPAVNLLIENLKKELEKAKLALEETQNELSAWKFTPDSNTGKRLMAKCRLLYQENEELGRMISCGRMAKLEGELALQRNFSEEMKKSQSELDEFLLELDEDVEGMQSTIYFLQQQLRQTRDQMATIQKENDKFRHHLDSSSEPGSNHHHRVQDSITRPTEEAVTESSSPSTRPPDQNEDDHDDVDRIRRGIVPMDVEKDDVITDVPSNQEEVEDNQETVDKNEIKVDEEEEEESPHETDLLIADDVDDVDKDVERRAEDETPKLTNTNRHSEAEEEDDDDVDKGINKKRKLENDVKSP